MNQEEASIDHGIPIKSFHHSSFALPFVSGSNKKGGGKHQISSHLSAYIMFRVPSKATYFPGNRQPRILNGVLKRNDFAAGRQNAERTSASVPTTNVPTHIYIFIYTYVCLYMHIQQRKSNDAGGERRQRPTREKFHRENSTRFPGRPVERGVERASSFFSACLTRANDPFEVNAP